MAELNSHLMERFGRSPLQHQQRSDEIKSYSCLPSELTKIRDLVQSYFDSTKSHPRRGWLAQPEFPSTAELLDKIEPDETYDTPDETHDMGGKDRLPSARRQPNVIHGSYSSAESYLQTHYELLRCDSIQPLREAIDHVRQFPHFSEGDHIDRALGIYDRVRIVGITFSTMGLAVRVCFSTTRSGKQILWEQSKRLMPGSLLALTPANDMFKARAIAVSVAARPLKGLKKNPPEIDLFFARPEEAEFDPAVEWVLIENRSAYFEADRHTMQALQKMHSELFPLQEHLVGAVSTVEQPDYFHADTLCVPPESFQSLDASQREAFERILTRKLAIIQGPPGTGKTHVSVTALQEVLRKSREEREDPPLIVACQTNHALDQILNHIAKFEPEFARLGSQSKDQSMNGQRTLFALKERLGFPTSGASRRAGRDAKKIQKEMTKLLEPVTKNKGPLTHKYLVSVGIMTEKHAQDIERYATEWAVSAAVPSELDTPMAVWVGKHLTPASISPYVDMLHFPVEEAELEFELLLETEAENQTRDEDEISLRGDYLALSDNYTCKTEVEARIKDFLSTCSDLSNTASARRAQIYLHYQRRLKDQLLEKFRSLTVAYSKHARERRIAKFADDASVLRNMKVIGMTTTGLSKYRAMIHALQPKIVLIEEAAETKEAPVAAACLPSLQYLILVGDHKQLRPQCHWKPLQGRPWYLDVSLFERLMNNEIESTMLTVQRRMIPEVRRSIWPIYGPGIADHESVKDLTTARPPIPGLADIRTFFYTSNYHHEQVDETMSPFNPAEADMLVGLYNYLMVNGVQPRQITILTFYNGQRKTIMKKLLEHPNLRGIRKDLLIRTVDSYQGEENDIILLSLVRSNEDDKIGFLSSQDRACVALSRAKRGMFLFGNLDLLFRSEHNMKKSHAKRIKAQRKEAEKDGTASLAPQPVEKATYFWTGFAKIIVQRQPPESSEGIPLPEIKGLPDGQSRAGTAFPIVCANHGRTTFINGPADWLDNDGGCDAACDMELLCGHRCPLRCHPYPHDKITCFEECGRRLLCGHICREPCNKKCHCNEARCLIAEQVESTAAAEHTARAQEEASRASREPMFTDVQCNGCSASVATNAQILPFRLGSQGVTAIATNAPEGEAAFVSRLDRQPISRSSLAVDHAVDSVTATDIMTSVQPGTLNTPQDRQTDDNVLLVDI